MNELLKLFAEVDKFANKMKAKLAIAYAEEDRVGWDNEEFKAPEVIDQINECIAKHQDEDADCLSNQAVDIANFAMFLDYKFPEVEEKYN